MHITDLYYLFYLKNMEIKKRKAEGYFISQWISGTNDSRKVFQLCVRGSLLQICGIPSPPLSCLDNDLICSFAYTT